MADKKQRMQTYVTYDPSKVIKDIEVSTTYIPALQSILSKRILDDPTKSETIGETFKKFEEIVKFSNLDNPTEEDVKNVPQLSGWESELYTLFSLVQLFKFKAGEQGLEIKTETDVTREEFQQMAKDAVGGADVSAKIKEIADRLRVVK